MRYNHEQRDENIEKVLKSLYVSERYEEVKSFNGRRRLPALERGPGVYLYTARQVPELRVRALPQAEEEEEEGASSGLSLGHYNGSSKQAL